MVTDHVCQYYILKVYYALIFIVVHELYSWLGLFPPSITSGSVKASPQEWRLSSHLHLSNRSCVQSIWCVQQENLTFNLLEVTKGNKSIVDAVFFWRGYFELS